jgi:mannose-6-phosphate isomerase-like protein (cupin superfamily)
VDEKRGLLRHFLAALAYRTQKALRGAPPEFGSFRAEAGVRTPAELVRHMTSVLGYARTFFVGGRYWPDALPSLEAEVERFHETLADLSRHLEAGTPLQQGLTPERVLQGPFSDAMTHAGQLAILRRLAGAPVPPENFVVAAIDGERLGPEQAAPVSPDDVWPEAPAGWTPPSHTPTPADLARLLADLDGMPAFLAGRFGSLGADEGALPGPDGAFSPVEHCWHLADLEREGYGVRIERLLRETEPVLPDFDGARLAEERHYRAKTLADGVRAFGAARRANLAALRGLAPADWTRRGSQEGVGQVRLSDVPRMMADHDQAHRVEIDGWLANRAPRVIRKVSLSEKLELFQEPWSPRVVGAVNEFHVKLVKLKGEFVWHAHEVEDELFLVLKGRLRMQLRDGEIVVEPGELVIVPHRTEHRPVADEEVHVLLLEPRSTVNTGTAGGERTREVEWI